MELNHFRRLKTDLDVRPIADEIAAQPEAWFRQTGRRCVRVQAEALAIPLRGLRVSRLVGVERRDVQESRYTTLSQSFVGARAFIAAFAREVRGRLGRAKIVNLPPGGRVHPPVDRGAYHARRDRHHVVIGSRGCGMQASIDPASGGPSHAYRPDVDSRRVTAPHAWTIDSTDPASASSSPR